MQGEVFLRRFEGNSYWYVGGRSFVLFVVLNNDRTIQLHGRTSVIAAGTLLGWMCRKSAYPKRHFMLCIVITN